MAEVLKFDFMLGCFSILDGTLSMMRVYVIFLSSYIRIMLFKYCCVIGIIVAMRWRRAVWQLYASLSEELFFFYLPFLKT
jgi:hypothetical protein